MKDCVIRFRCTEDEKTLIEMLASADVWSESVSEYLLNLVREDADNYREVPVYGVVRGVNKAGDNYIEKRREMVGCVLVEKGTGKTSKSEYGRLWDAARAILGSTADKPNHHLFLECEGQEVKTNALTSYAIFGKA